MTVVITKAEYDKEVAYARLSLIADIQKKLKEMKKPKRNFNPHALTDRVDLNHTYSNQLGQEWGYNQALTDVNKYLEELITK